MKNDSKLLCSPIGRGRTRQKSSEKKAQKNQKAPQNQIGKRHA